MASGYSFCFSLHVLIWCMWKSLQHSTNFGKLINLNLSWITYLTDWVNGLYRSFLWGQDETIGELKINTFIIRNYSSLFLSCDNQFQFWYRECSSEKCLFIFFYFVFHFNRRKTCNIGFASLTTRCYLYYTLSINQIYAFHSISLSRTPTLPLSFTRISVFLRRNL